MPKTQNLIKDYTDAEFLQHLLSKGIRQGECLIWPRATNGKYGKVYRHGINELVHRLVFCLTDGVQLDVNELVLHSCRNKLCFERKHLRVGDHTINALEAVIDGSLVPVKGEQHPHVKLTDKQVAEIRELYSTNLYSTRQLGRMFNVTGGYICRLVNFLWRA